MNVDVVVIGLGAMGSATAYQLAKRGVTVTGIDRFSPPHAFGSTHGDTRMTRQATSEGEAYVLLAIRSQQLWREIESETGTDLFTACGNLILTAASVSTDQYGGSGFFAATVYAAKEYGIEHEVLSTDETRSRFPQFHLNEEYLCYYEPGAGFVRPEAAVAAQLELASRHGAHIHRNERVTRMEATSNGVTVHTDRATYAADQAIVTAGPWIGQLAGGSSDIAQLFGIYRQVQHWFDTTGSDVSLTADHMPAFIWRFGPEDSDYFYGFPAINGLEGGLKVATEQHTVTTDPDTLNQEVSAEESRVMFKRYVDGRLPLRASVIKTDPCIKTVTPDTYFIIDRHPEHPNVLLASPCSGNGFKHSAAIGEALAEWAIDGKPTINLSTFALERFAS
ncbi:MAG: N-methyl-L-tryptophan oxidase [Candidatus Dormibacteraceae bacterium]